LPLSVSPDSKACPLMGHSLALPETDTIKGTFGTHKGERFLKRDPNRRAHGGLTANFSRWQSFVSLYSRLSHHLYWVFVEQASCLFLFFSSNRLEAAKSAGGKFPRSKFRGIVWRSVRNRHHKGYLRNP
jgi:hypothetical protein